MKQSARLQVWIDNEPNSRWETIDSDAVTVGWAARSFANDLLDTWLVNRGHELDSGSYRVVIEDDAGHPNIVSDDQEHTRAGS